MELNGKRAIVVGGASGMALASVELLIRNGVKVAILDLPTSRGAEDAERLGIGFHPCNVMDFAGTEGAIRNAAAALGGLHIVVNTAGGGIARRTLGKDGPHPIEEFQQVVNLNLVSSFNVARIAADIMSKGEPDEGGERGVIISTASIAAFEGQIGQVAYSAAKAGIAGMTLTMARDLGNVGIRAMSIAPSLFSTGITAGIPPEMAAVLTKDAAFPKRMGLPNEYALLVKGIAENPMLNGSCIRLDAGVRFSPK